MSTLKRTGLSHLARLSALALLLGLLPVLGSATDAAASVNFTQIDGGGSQVCGVTGSGGAECWGFGGWGALGNGDTSDRSHPVQVSGLSSGVQQVAAGFTFSCALMTGGSVKCWGYDGNGELGDGTNTQSLTPVDVSGITNATQIDAGDEHACALLGDETVQCWGYGFYGQLGDNDPEHDPSNVPVNVSGITDATQIATGSTHSCAIVNTDAMECWGHNQNGEIGDGGAFSPAYVPDAVTGLSSGVTAIAAHGEHTCALVSGGMKCWGRNDFGEAGTGLPDSNYDTPQDVSGLTSGVDKIATGDSACAVSSGGLQCWGRNFFGEVGDGTHGPGNDRHTPVAVSGLSSGVSEITTAGGTSACAIMDDHSAKCWGNNSSGQLGNDNDDVDSDVPVDVVSGAAPSADLRLTVIDSPDPVTSENNVIYRFVVDNLGPDTAGEITLTITPDPSLTTVSMPGQCNPSGNDIVCSLGHPASVEADIVMKAPVVLSDPLDVTTTASVSETGADDPVSGNNSVSETTTVNAPDTGSGSGYVPPEGGSVSTGTQATADDPVALTMTLPPGGPGGTAKVAELPTCKPFKTCVGVASNWVPPAGYDQLTAVLRYDGSIVPAARLAGAASPWKVLYKKAPAHRIFLPTCRSVSQAPPCVKQAKVLASGDLRLRVSLNSDPKLASRK